MNRLAWWDTARYVHSFSRRQDIPPAYYRNGCIYIVRRSALYDSRSLMAKPTGMYEMPEHLLLNIDNKRDVLIAEVLMEEWTRGDTDVWRT